MLYKEECQTLTVVSWDERSTLVKNIKHGIEVFLPPSIADNVLNEIAGELVKFYSNCTYSIYRNFKIIENKTHLKFLIEKKPGILKGIGALKEINFFDDDNEKLDQLSLLLDQKIKCLPQAKKKSKVIKESINSMLEHTYLFLVSINKERKLNYTIRIRSMVRSEISVDFLGLAHYLANVVLSCLYKEDLEISLEEDTIESYVKEWSVRYGKRLTETSKREIAVGYKL